MTRSVASQAPREAHRISKARTPWKACHEERIFKVHLNREDWDIFRDRPSHTRGGRPRPEEADIRHYL